MLRMTRQSSIQLEERIAERTRIAQDLHDTLLQGVLSASMQLHVAVDILLQDSPARPKLERTLQLISQVISEGREHSARTPFSGRMGYRSEKFFIENPAGAGRPFEHS
jgi:signal transduction histidine kinase